MLKGISLEIQPNAHYGILGPSGIGKSTLLRVLLGIDLPSEGEIILDKSYRPSVVFQHSTLLPWKTLKANIELFCHSSVQNIPNVLSSLGIADYSNTFPREMSGGILQRANIAVALLREPNVLVFDEPYSSLDYLTKHIIYDYILSIQKRSDLASVMVTHDIAEALLLCDHILILSEEADGAFAYHRQNRYDQSKDMIKSTFQNELTQLYAMLKNNWR